MKESSGSFSLSFQPTKIAQKWVKSESTTYTRKQVFKNDSDGENTEEGTKDELLSGFDESGALSLNPENHVKKGPLVIPPLKNRDWRQEILKLRGKLHYIPNEESLQSKQITSEKKEDIQVYGLTFPNSKKNTSSEEELQSSNKISEESNDKITGVENTEEELAIKALLAEVEEKKTESNLVLPMPSDTNLRTNVRPLTEDELYRRDILSLPDPATLEEYENVPVEEFGNALLRGMGWKEGEGIGKNKKEASIPNKMIRRSQFLGIGAKEYQAEQNEVGTYQKNGTKKRIDMTYIPLVKVNKATGEIIHETPIKNESKEIYEKSTFKEYPENFKDTSSKKYSQNYSSKKNGIENRYRDYDQDRYRSSMKKNSENYKHHHNTSRHRS